MADQPEKPASPRAAELVKIGLLLAAMLFAQVVVTRSLVLFHHALWLDEILTSTLINDPSFTHALSALRSGVDTNPPTMYIILWPIARMIGGLNETGLPIVSFVAMVLALLGVFAICRMHFSAMASFVGAMVVAAHPVVVRHAFEGRFYGPWLAATVWYVFTLSRLRSPPTRARLTTACVLATLMTTVHYFGIVAIILITLVDLLVHRGLVRDRMLGIIPLAFALLALNILMPFVIHQSAGLQVRTWIEPATYVDVRTMMSTLLGAPAVLWVLFAVAILRLVHVPASPQVDSRNLSPLLPFAALLLFPLFIVGFSIFVQPALMDRYMIVAIAPLGALSAYLVSGKPRAFVTLIILGLFLAGAMEVRSNAALVRGRSEDFQDVINAIHKLGDSQTVVFKRRTEMYPLMRIAPEILTKTPLLDFDTDQDPHLRPISIYERDMARKFQQSYSRINLIRREDLARQEHFFVIVPPGGTERDEVQKLFPERRVEPHGDWVVEVSSR